MHQLHLPPFPGQKLNRTLPFFCPVSKYAIALKQQQIKNDSEKPNNKTYTNIVKTTIKETTLPAKPVIKGVVWVKMVKIIKFLFFAQKVSSGMEASHPKFLGG